MCPMQRERYPDDWEAISRRIRFERAGGKCEQCGAPHGALIVRSAVDAGRFLIFDERQAVYTTPDGTWLRLSEIPDEFDLAARHVRVVLTVHHIGAPLPDGTPGDPHDKLDCRDENLIGLCQRCHLIADLPHHVERARATRLRKKARALAEAGQRRLF